MLTLYYKPTCPYCQKVLRASRELNLELDLKDIVADPQNAEDLIKRGGKRQVPYLVDTDRNIEMYESDDIIHHLRQHYGN